MIIKADYISQETASLAAAFTSRETAVDLADKLTGLSPAWLECLDGELFQRAETSGKKYQFIDEAEGPVQAVIMIGFDDFSARSRSRKLKRAVKMLSQEGVSIVSSDDHDPESLRAIREATSYSLTPAEKDDSAPPIMHGAYVPSNRFEEFWQAVADLASRHHVELPIKRRILDGVVYVYPILKLNKVGDKQKLFKILADYASLVDSHGGHLIGEAAEGRAKASFAYKALDKATLKLFEDIKAAFDPHGILNPDVKQDQQLKQLVSRLRSDCDTPLASSESLSQ